MKKYVILALLLLLISAIYFLQRNDFKVNNFNNTNSTWSLWKGMPWT